MTHCGHVHVVGSVGRRVGRTGYYHALATPLLSRETRVGGWLGSVGGHGAAPHAWHEGTLN